MAARLLAASAAVCVTVGASAFASAVGVNQGLWYGGYVSEAGAPGSAQAVVYRVGIGFMAIGLLLLALTLRRPLPLAAALLGGSGLLASASSAVSCSAGCPLPPYQTPTFGDLVHAAASVGSVAACLAAIGVVALPGLAARGPWPDRVGADAGVRRFSRAFLVVAGPLFVLAAASLLGLGRGVLTGTLERALLVVIAGWTLLTSITMAARRR